MSMPRGRAGAATRTTPVFAAPAAMVAQVGKSGKIKHAHCYRADERTLTRLGVPNG
jgi:hypothetical protein